MSNIRKLERRLVACLQAAALIAPAIAAAQETISFPSRSSDLANDSYWTVGEFGEGCCTLDLNVRRWNGSGWNKGTGSSTNAQDHDWNVPLYAPANGVIAMSQNATATGAVRHAAPGRSARRQKSMRPMASIPYTPKSAVCPWTAVVLSPCM
jgi:hypothetical protein